MKKQKRGTKEAKENLPLSWINQIRTNRVAFAVYLTLCSITVFVMVRCFFNRQWESLFICFLTFALYMIPPVVEKHLKVELPTTLECVAFFFVFCAEILGEISAYYVKFPIWDTILHTVNGFMFAAFGFCLVDILNKNKKFRFALSPLYMALVSFCFSMTIGVLWEFLEFGVDHIIGMDMQKDFIVHQINSVTLDPTLSNSVVSVKDILQTTIETADGNVIVLNGYLDLGLKDTMKDLLVNFVGASVFSVIGYFYVKQRGKGKIANQFIPVPMLSDTEETAEAEVPNLKDAEKETETQAEQMPDGSL